MKHALYPGTFDPITNGHLDIIERAAEIFHRLSVVVARNDRKQPRIPLDERMELICASVAHCPNVDVVGLDGLLIDYARKAGIDYVVRGLRAVSDFEYELQLALMNRQMYDRIETIFLMPRQEYIFLSSNMVREIAALGGDFQRFVPGPAYERIRARLAPTNS